MANTTIEAPARRRGWAWYSVAELSAAVDATAARLVSVRRRGASRASVANLLRQLDCATVGVHDDREVVEFWDGSTVRHVTAREFGVVLGVSPVAAPAAPIVEPKKTSPRKRSTARKSKT